MIDTVAQYAIQFAAIVAGAMALAEWATIPIGVVGKSRKPSNMLLYSFVLGMLGWCADLVQMPSDVWYKAAAGIVVLSVVATGTAHLAVTVQRQIAAK